MLNLILKYRKYFIFNVFVGALLLVFLSLYTGLFMQSNQPELHNRIVQLVCSGDERAETITQNYHLPGELRVNQKIICINADGKQRVIGEFKTFLYLGILLPLIITVCVCIVLSFVFRKKLKTRTFKY